MISINSEVKLCRTENKKLCLNESKNYRKFLFSVRQSFTSLLTRHSYDWAMVLMNFNCQGFLLVRVMVGQGSTVLAVGGGELL